MRENSAVATLLNVLPDELMPARDRDLVHISLGGRRLDFEVMWVGEGLPADARRGASRLADRRSNAQAGGAIPVIVARKVSSGSRKLLEEAGISWADTSGRAKIVVPGRLYIDRLEPTQVSTRRGMKWSTASEALAEVVLTDHIDWRETPRPLQRVSELAARSGVSLPHASRVLRQFDEQGYTCKSGAERGTTAARELSDPGRLLSDWAGHYVASGGPGGGVELHVPWREPEKLIALLDDLLGRTAWALSGEAAADQTAPFLTSVSRVEAYVSRDHFAKSQSLLTRHPDVTAVDSGGRILLYPAEEHVLDLAKEKAEARIVSPVRVYADLLRQGGRHAEAAEHLRETTIGY